MQTGIADLQGGQSEVVKQQGEMIKRVDRLDYAVFGIPDTDERGLLGEMREISKKLDHLLLTGIGLILTGVAIAVAIAQNG